jgi:hypothetical protein
MLPSLAIALYILLGVLRSRRTGDSALILTGKLLARCIVHVAAFVLALFRALDWFPRFVVLNYLENVKVQLEAMPQIRKETAR